MREKSFRQIVRSGQIANEREKIAFCHRSRSCAARNQHHCCADIARRVTELPALGAQQLEQPCVLLPAAATQSDQMDRGRFHALCHRHKRLVVRGGAVRVVPRRGGKYIYNTTTPTALSPSLYCS